MQATNAGPCPVEFAITTVENNGASGPMGSLQLHAAIFVISFGTEYSKRMFSGVSINFLFGDNDRLGGGFLNRSMFLLQLVDLHS